MDFHEKLGKAHTKLEKARSLLLEENKKRLLYHVMWAQHMT